MNSVKAVSVYVVLCQGSVGRKLESLVQEKGDAVELVLDGQLHQSECKTNQTEDQISIPAPTPSWKALMRQRAVRRLGLSS